MLGYKISFLNTTHDAGFLFWRIKGLRISTATSPPWTCLFPLKPVPGGISGQHFGNLEEVIYIFSCLCITGKSQRQLPPPIPFLMDNADQFSSFSRAAFLWDGRLELLFPGMEGWNYHVLTSLQHQTVGMEGAAFSLFPQIPDSCSSPENNDKMHSLPPLQRRENEGKVVVY